MGSQLVIQFELLIVRGGTSLEPIREVKSPGAMTCSYAVTGSNLMAGNGHSQTRKGPLLLLLLLCVVFVVVVFFFQMGSWLAKIRAGEISRLL